MNILSNSESKTFRDSKVKNKVSNSNLDQYDTVLPPHVRAKYQQPDRYAQYRERNPIQPPKQPPPGKSINGWTLSLVVILIGLGAALLNRHNQASNSRLGPAPAAVSTPAIIAPAPAPPIKSVPRAEPVSGPLTTSGQPMISGRQYLISMPDGRHILVNYKGWVDHACNLPRQPKGGANNAAYTELATGNTWVWTVPAGASNVPQWIDP
jgi:hypothetical protein